MRVILMLLLAAPALAGCTATEPDTRSTAVPPTVPATISPPIPPTPTIDATAVQLGADHMEARQGDTLRFAWTGAALRGATHSDLH